MARLPEIGALINADVSTASPYDYKVAAQLDRFELQKLSPFIGAIEARSSASPPGRSPHQDGWPMREIAAFVNITELDAGIGVPVTLNSPLNATLKGDDGERSVRARRLGPIERVGPLEHEA